MDKELKKDLDSVVGAKFEMVLIPFAEQRDMFKQVAFKAWREKAFKYSAKEVPQRDQAPPVNLS